MAISLALTGPPNQLVSFDGSGNGTSIALGAAYFTNLNAAMEPMALELPQIGTFSYVVPNGTTKIVIASYFTAIGASGRWEVRDPKVPGFINGATLNGLSSPSTALIANPALPSYADPVGTYYSRMAAMQNSVTQIVPLLADSTAYLLLPGPYGNIITRVVNFDWTWVIAQPQATTGIGVNLANELGDNSSQSQRNYNALTFPVNKSGFYWLYTGVGAGGIPPDLGSVQYFICPASWGAVTDPISYLFRDDFMGATLNTSVWTRVQSTAGNVEIDPAFQWLKMVGNGSWGANGIYSQFSVTRAPGRVFLVDVLPQIGSGNNPPEVIVGWSDGLGQSYTNFAHGVHFTAGALELWENGNSRSATNRWSRNNIYRVRITLTATGATYEMQSSYNSEYAQLGGNTWTNITPGTTSSPTTTLHAGATIQTGPPVYCRVGDMRLY
jgi:hypothetical protein